MTKCCGIAQISGVACVMLAVLRIAIGWQFLYEGLWKLNTQKTPTSWSADGYLGNAQGPLRDQFRKMAKDPDGLRKLDYASVVADWDRLRNDFVHYYQRVPADPDKLSNEQLARITKLVDGDGEFSQPLAKLPDGVDLSKFRFRKPSPGDKAFVKYDAAKKQLVTNTHLLPEEIEEFVKLAPKDAPGLGQYVDASKKLVRSSGELSLKERLRVLLVEDRDRNGLIQNQYKGSVDYHRPGDAEIYRHLVERYNQDLKAANVKYQHDHLQRQWAEIQERKGKLVAPVDALTAELHAGLYDVLTAKQVRYGTPPAPPQPWVNQSVIWGLIVLGSLMLVGLFSRTSCLGAGLLLFSFYLAMPPLPGIPEAPGPDHSLIVNKNLIECLACLALATIPTGRWLGLDALLRRLLFRKTTD